MVERKPSWLRTKLPSSPAYRDVTDLVREQRLNTVCEDAKCPNRSECWSRGTATVMILGSVCTRRCTFCAIDTGRPTELDLGEPARVAEAVATMKLQHCVITSVARDDLKDGGAGVWAATIRAVRHRNPGVGVEVLIPDFLGHEQNLDTVLEARPDILNHNMETVERLQKPIRKTARYDRSHWVLERAKSQGLVTKSGLMLGIGEKENEIAKALRDLAAIDLDILTLGQYLQPTPDHSPVDRWVRPEEFEHWRQFGLEIGFRVVESGPLVRSSYHAEEQSAAFGRGLEADEASA